MRFFVCLVLLSFSFFGLGQTLTVFVASSLTAPFTELAEQFEQQHKSVRIDLQFAGSSLLVTQLEQGAKADVLATADQTTMARLVSLDEAKIFASNAMVVVTNHPEITTLKHLATQRHFLVLAHKNVPAGAYARASLLKLNELFGGGFSEAVLTNLVSEETNVKRALAKVTIAEADVAIVYKTDVSAASRVRVIPIPEDANVKALYPIVVLPETKHASLAAEFIDFVLSHQGKLVLQGHGFGLP